MKDFDLNDPSTWANAQVYTAPPDFDLAGYQSLIDKVCGLQENNYPTVRLVWAGDRKKCYSRFYVTWHEAGPKKGLGLSSELRAKYKVASLLVPGTSDIIDVPPPRWILEEYNHPAQYMESWEAARFVGGREARPAPPPNGYYSWLFTIAEHGNGDCCEEAGKNKLVCWGTYREPGEDTLQRLRRAIQEREADRFVDTTKPLDQTTLDILGRETAQRIEDREKAADRKMDEYIDENIFEILEGFGIPVSDRARKTIYSIPKMTQIKGESAIIIGGSK